MKRLPSRLVAVSDALERQCHFIAPILIAIMTLIMTALIFTRYVMGYSFPWAEESTRYIMAWMVMVLIGPIHKRNGHIGIHYFIEMLPPKTALALNLFFSLIVVVLLGFVTWHGFELAVDMGLAYSSSLHISMFFPYLAIPIGALLALLFSLINLAGDYMRLLSREEEE